jgi:hypothetical protein
MKAAPLIATATVIAMGLGAPAARADGLSSCTENPDKLNAEAQKTIELIKEKVPLGCYETSETVLQFVNKSLSGFTTQTSCADIMAYHATGRIDGTINAPQGPGLN